MLHLLRSPFEWLLINQTPMGNGTLKLWMDVYGSDQAPLACCKSPDSKRAYDAAPQATATFSRQWMSTATAT